MILGRRSIKRHLADVDALRVGCGQRHGSDASSFTSAFGRSSQVNMTGTVNRSNAMDGNAKSSGEAVQGEDGQQGMFGAQNFSAC